LTIDVSRQIRVSCNDRLTGFFFNPRSEEGVGRRKQSRRERSDGERREADKRFLRQTAGKSRQESVGVSALHPAAVLRKHPMRVLKCPGLSARPGGALRAGAARRSALAAANRARAGPAPMPPMAPATGWCGRPDTSCKASTARSPTSPRRIIFGAGSAWRPPSTGWTDPVTHRQRLNIGFYLQDRCKIKIRAHILKRCLMRIGKSDRRTSRRPMR
jgi:hypothetical protein